MVTGQTPGVVKTPLWIIGTDVVGVPLAQPLNGILNGSVNVKGVKRFK